MTVEMIIAVALSSAIIVIVLALVGIIIYQRWRIGDKNAALGKFIRENAELRQEREILKRATPFFAKEGNR